MLAAAPLIAPPLALGGESLGGESTALAALTLVSIVLGYLLIWGLWYFVFRDPERRRRKDRPRR